MEHLKMNVVELKTHKIQENEEVMEMLENLMELASAGKIQSLCHVVRFDDGDCGSAYSRGFAEDVFSAIASLECLKTRFVHMAIDND